MNRNERRVERPAPPTQSPLTPSLNSAPARMEFPVPTEFVDLPSRGTLYPPGHAWHNRAQVEIKHMTAKEEDVLTSQNYISKGIVLDKFVQSVLVEPVDPGSLFLIDRTAILVAARVTGYGDSYDTLITCPSCRVEFEISFSVEESLQVNLGELDFVESGLYTVQFDGLDADVKIRSLTVSDQLHFEKSAALRAKSGLPETSVTSLLRAMIFSVNGSTEVSDVSNFIDSLSAKNSKVIRSSYKVVMPSINLSHNFNCQRCGHEAELEVPLNADFFWPG